MIQSLARPSMQQSISCPLCGPSHLIREQQRVRSASRVRGPRRRTRRGSSHCYPQIALTTSQSSPPLLRDGGTRTGHGKGDTSSFDEEVCGLQHRDGHIPAVRTWLIHDSPSTRHSARDRQAEPGSDYIQKRMSGRPSLKRRSWSSFRLLFQICFFRKSAEAPRWGCNATAEWRAAARHQKTEAAALDSNLRWRAVTPTLAGCLVDTLGDSHWKARLRSKKLNVRLQALSFYIRGRVRDAKLARQHSLARFVNTRRGLGSRARSQLRQSLWHNVERDWLIGNSHL